MASIFDLEKDRLFEVGSTDTIWKKYCGFLDLSLEDFMVIQKALLMEQVELVWDTGLTRMIVKGKKPATVDEFRRMAPLTTYDDYTSVLSQKKAEALATRPVIWARTSGTAGVVKWAPYSAGNVARLADDTLSAFILSAAKRKGEVRVRPDAKVVLNLPSMPFTSGIMAWAASERLSYQAIPPLDMAERMSVQDKIISGFKIALGTGVDYAASNGVVLTRVGESFSQMSRKQKLADEMWHPMALWRVFQALIKSKLAKRAMLPKDIWKIKGLVCGGTDTCIYRDRIYQYWGVQPLDAYVSTETGFIAMQGWNKKDMTFIPYTNFYEFIPEEERKKEKEDAAYQPATLLLDEVKPGNTYEIVVTNFHGGAFLRYRLGDLVTVNDLTDEQTGVRLPQVTFVGRADEIIDISGFTRLDEKVIWSAIQNSSIPYEDWCARKENLDGKPALHLYIETKTNGVSATDVTRMVDAQLVALDDGYRDLRNMTGTEPLTVTLLNSGTFARCIREKQDRGTAAGSLKPPHINASDAEIDYLITLDKKPQEKIRQRSLTLT